MTHTVNVRNVTSGSLSHDGTDYDIRDGTISGLDAATARALVAAHKPVEWLDDPPSDGSDSDSDHEANADADDAAADEDICGAVMSDDSVCERPADECPYHGED